MITNLEDLHAAIGGGDDPPVTNKQRKDYNSYIQWLQKRGIAGKPELDKNNLGKNLLAKYIKENPSTSLTANSIIPMQKELAKVSQWQLDKNGGSTDDNHHSVIDGLHSKVTSNTFPDEYIKENEKAENTSDDESTEFADWTGTKGDTKAAAKDLMKRGLIGADQILNATVDTNDASSIKNSQADWKPAAIQEILANAKKLNLRKPEEINANKDVLVSNPRFRDAINNPAFNQIHKNFWDVITNSILPEQWDKFDKMAKTQTAKK